MIKIKNKYALDQKDELLIRLLTERGRASLSELGRFLGITSQSVGRRLQAMEKAGVIEGYMASINWDLILEPGEVEKAIKEWAEHESD